LNDEGQCNVGNWTGIIQVAAGAQHTVGLKTDGTVVAVGDNYYGECDVGGWMDIVQVAAGHDHTVGVKADGTVVAVGSDYSGQCDVDGWTDIVQVSAGGFHTVGLKSDGTVVAVGWNDDDGQCEVGGWTGIIQVAAGGYHTVGLKADGTVVAVGKNDDGQCEVGGWTDIVQVAAGYYHTVGVKADGTVVAVGKNDDGQCNVGGWTDITQVAAGVGHTVGLKSDGTVVAVGDNDDGECDVGGWTDIIGVAAGVGHTVGLKSDGTVVAVGWNDDDGQCEVGGWTGIILVAAGYRHTVGFKADGTVVAAGLGAEFATWNLVLALPPSQRVLTISITAGGSVTTPGEGTFTHEEGTVVDIVAEPGEHYRFVNWTGDVDTIANVNAAQTTITMEDYYAITANFELEEGLCSLTISSTTGGSVTTPGEGTSIYDEGTVVDLVAEAEEGYLFVNWTGDVGTLADVTAASTTITMDDNYSITANFVGVKAGDVGVKAGDWIKVGYKITGWPAGEPYPEWLKLEFLSVEGTSANVRVTMHMSDGTEQSDTVPVDVVAGGGESFGLSGFVISTNLTTGDSVYITGYGNVAIEGETTRTYAGARRTVVYASISQSVPFQDEVQLTYYWDKQTGVMVEASTTYTDITATAKATETNMWEATTVGMPWWPWIIVAAAAGLGIFFVRRRRAA